MLAAWPTGNGDEVATSFRHTPCVVPVHFQDDWGLPVSKVRIRRQSFIMELHPSLRCTRW